MWAEDLLPGEDPFIQPWMVDFADDHYALDISRAKSILGWAPKRSLRAMLPKMVATLKANPLKWYKENKLPPPAELGAATPAPTPEHMSTVEHNKMLREHMTMMEDEHKAILWAHFVNILLGFWLISSPFALGFRGETAMLWSDVLSGALIVVFGALSLSYRYRWAQWANTFVGIWLLFAPLVFWTTSAAAYANDTLVGSLVIGLAVLIPMMPGMSMEGMMSGPDIPPGWTYTPSSWTQRLPIIALAFVGFFLARQMAAYQLGHIESLWDPFFGEGMVRIITSEVSRAWPIPDAGLGALSYMLEALSGMMSTGFCLSTTAVHLLI